MTLIFSERWLSDDFRSHTQLHMTAAQEALQRLRQRECTGSEFAGWFCFPQERGFSLLQEIEANLAKLDLYYDTVVVLGIGGSYAGTKAVSSALSHTFEFGIGGGSGQRTRPIIFAGNNLTESAILDILEFLDHKQPLVTVVSKSGTTLETAVALRVFADYLERRFGEKEAKRRLIAITDASSGTLRQFVEKEGLLSFPIPNDVGGRYSVLTAVGLVPLALAGYNVRALMEGADALFSGLPESGSHPTLTHACVRKAAWDAGLRVDVFAYSNPKLTAFLEWWKQLFAESEGKEGKGLFPSGMLYTADLHSIGQYMQEGCPQMLETFLLVGSEGNPTSTGERRIRVPRSHLADGLAHSENRFLADINAAALEASMMAHSERGVPCLELKIPVLDEFHLGYLFAYFSTVCALSADLLGVNPFDQPGVEAYKTHLRALLQMSATGATNLP